MLKEVEDNSGYIVASFDFENWCLKREVLKVLN